MPIDVNYELYDNVSKPGDINEHLLQLAKLSRECESILQLGCDFRFSCAWAFVNGLLKNKKTTKSLAVCHNNVNPASRRVEEACVENGIDYSYTVGKTLDLPTMTQDMVFIDSWQVYGQVKRELAKFAPTTHKYIVLHDTEIDKVHGATVRNRWNAEQQSRESGIPVEEIQRGIGPAIEEFLAANPEWRVKQHFTHQYGLTILERVPSASVTMNV